MAKRKASDNTTEQTNIKMSTTTPSLSLATPPKLTAQEIKAKEEEHRRYLEGVFGVKAEDCMPPPAKKRKASPTKKKQTQVEVAAIAQSATSAVNGESDMPHSSASSRRQTSDDSPESTKSAHDSATGAENNEQPAKKRKATSSPDDSSKPAPTKRKRKFPKTSESSDKKPTKKGNARPRRAPGTPEATRPPPPPPPPPAPLTLTLSAKLDQIRKFVATVPETDTRVTRNPNSTALISVTETELVAALMRMRVDYGLSGCEDVYATTVDDAGEIIINGFLAPFLQHEETQWVTIDINMECELEMEAQAKLRGHGVEDFNLLELELEMAGSRQASLARSEVDIWRPEVMKETRDRTYPHTSEMSSAEVMQETFDRMYERISKAGATAKATLADLEARQEAQAAGMSGSRPPEQSTPASLSGTTTRTLGVCPEPAALVP